MGGCWNCSSSHVRSAVVLLGWLLLAQSSMAYNRPECDSWPSDDVWETELRALLSSEAVLNGPFRNNALAYAKECLLERDQHYVNLFQQGKGLCMGNHVCANEFCLAYGRTNLPAYTIEMKTIKDVQVALTFAQRYDIGISVKSSGHSYQAQSTQADSLLLWFRHFPFTNTITQNYINTCGTVFNTTISVAAGENFDDVWRAVGSDYHVVTGNCQTVCLSGGWIQGGGLSFTARTYGYGVDQAVSFDVVLADGSLVKADACENSDLFWALRGGGGGNYGIVVNLEYELHPKTPVTYLEFKFDGIPGLQLLTKRARTFMRSWLTFLVNIVPTLDQRWGGAFGHSRTRLFFMGTIEEALQSDLVIAMDQWYDVEVVQLDPGFGRPSELLVEYPSFFEFQGGEEAYENPEYDYLAVSVPSFLPFQTFSRIIPMEVAVDRPDELVDLLMDMSLDGEFSTFSNYILGGATNDVAPDATAMNPVMRRIAFGIEAASEKGAQKLRDFVGNDVSGVSYNHHSAREPDWERASWGDNFERLKEIKAKYDPGHRFNVYHGVDFRGPVFGEDEQKGDSTSPPGCPRKDKKSVFSAITTYMATLRFLADFIFSGTL